MAEITLVQVNTIIAGGYQTVSTATSPNSSMPPQIFTFDYFTNNFSHVSTLFDVNNFPSTPTPGQAFYRLAAVTQIFANLLDAENNITAMQQRVASLVNLYTEAAGLFPGTLTNTYSG
jgi:hypothetical protein